MQIILAFTKSITSRKTNKKDKLFDNKNQYAESSSDSDDNALSDKSENEELDENNRYNEEAAINEESEADAVKVEEETTINDDKT